jgi:hypothetical protein
LGKERRTKKLSIAQQRRLLAKKTLLKKKEKEKGRQAILDLDNP